MALSLYEVSVGGPLRTVAAVAGILDKGLAWAREAGVDPQTIVETRLAPDMFSFRFQVLAVCAHSAGAIACARTGVYVPPEEAGEDYAALQAAVARAQADLQAVTPDEVEAFEGREMVFVLGERRFPAPVAPFLIRFSLPNLHFHATTAYDILRQAGAPIGKRDYLGAWR